MPLPQALGLLRQCLPRHAVIVGQNISKDVQWLGLREGQDFEQMMDLTGLYRIWNERYKSFSVFGQDHLAKVLLGWETQPGGHDAGVHALAHACRALHALCTRIATVLRGARQAGHASTVSPTDPAPCRLHAVGDAVKSIRLFTLHQQLQANPDAWQEAQQRLLEAPPEPSFAKLNPSWEGVCMGNRKTCTCGAAFLG